MATYTASGGRLICTGTDITTAGIKAAIDSNPSVGTATVRAPLNASYPEKTEYEFRAEIDIGNNSVASTWTMSNEIIKIYATALDINGSTAKIVAGSLNSDGFPINEVELTRVANPTDTARRGILIKNGGTFEMNGGVFRARRTSNNNIDGLSEITVQNATSGTILMNQVDIDAEYGVGQLSGWGYVSGTYSATFNKCRWFGNSDQGPLIVYNTAGQVTATEPVIESLPIAFQIDSPNLTTVVKDALADSCTNHFGGTYGLSFGLTFLNPDFTEMRSQALFINAAFNGAVMFRYSLTVTDTSDTAINGARVIIIDGQSAEVLNDTTDSNGQLTSLSQAGGEDALYNSKYVNAGFIGITRTDHSAHTTEIKEYGYDTINEAFTVDRDITQTRRMLTDSTVAATKAVAGAYTETDTDQKTHDKLTYDYAVSSTAGLTKPSTYDGSVINCGAFNVEVDPLAAATLYNGSTIVIKASSVGSITTTGTITLSNGADFDGVLTDTSGVRAKCTAPNLIDGSRVRLYNVTQDVEIDNSTISGGAGYEITLTGSDVADGDIVRLTVTYSSGSTYKNRINTTGQFSTTSGLTFLNSQTDWAEANSLSVDGSAQTEFTADYPNIEVDVDASGNEFNGSDLIGWLLYIETTADGIRNFFGSINSSSNTEWEIQTSVVNLYLDNVNASTATQQDNVIISRDDGVYPQQSPTSGGGGIGLNKIANTGLNSTESSNLSSIKAVTDNIPDSGALTTIDGNIDAIKAKTGNLPSDPASDTTVNTRLAASAYTAPDNAGIAQTQIDIAALNDVSASDVVTAMQASADDFKADVSTIGTQVDEMHKIHGLDSGNPMTVTTTSRSAGTITQTISGDGETTSTVTRT